MKIKYLFIVLFAVFLLLPVVSHAAGDFNYQTMEKIPGFENATGQNFTDYIVAVYKFGIWAIGIAALLMISIGAYYYLISAGNTSTMGKGKEIITDAIIGVIMAMTAYLLLYTINPDLVNITDISTTSSTTEGNPPPGGPGGPSSKCCVKSNTPGQGDYGNYNRNCAQPTGNQSDQCDTTQGFQIMDGSCGSLKACGGGTGSGTCKVLESGPCAPGNLGGCNWNTEQASAICNAESGGREDAASGTDKCTDGNSFSWGLFQINLTCQCKTVFTPQKPKGCVNYSCRVSDRAGYDACVRNFTTASYNISKACAIYRYGGWGQWGANSKCKFPTKGR